MPCGGGGVRTVRDGTQPCAKSGSARCPRGPSRTVADGPSRTLPAHSYRHSPGVLSGSVTPVWSPPSFLKGNLRKANGDRTTANLALTDVCVQPALGSYTTTNVQKLPAILDAGEAAAEAALPAIRRELDCGTCDVM